MTASTFLFATGIENSYPDDQRWPDPHRRDGEVRPLRPLARRFRLRPRDRHQLSALRSADPHDLSRARAATTGNSADITFGELRRRDITPIVDLCHFGVPDWIGNFQNPDFPAAVRPLCAAPSRNASRGFSSIRRSTRCSSARSFSAKYGWWNEQLKTDQAFVTALKHIVKANVLAMLEILKSAPTPSSSSANPRNISMPTARPRSTRPNSELPPLPPARSELRPAGRLRHVRISHG